MSLSEPRSSQDEIEAELPVIPTSGHDESYEDLIDDRQRRQQASQASPIPRSLQKFFLVKWFHDVRKYGHPQLKQTGLLVENFNNGATSKPEQLEKPWTPGSWSSFPKLGLLSLFGVFAGAYQLPGQSPIRVVDYVTSRYDSNNYTPEYQSQDPR